MSEGYADTILLDCNRLSSVQAKSDTNNDGLSTWTNKLGTGVKLKQGDRVSIHSGFISERGAGGTTIEFEGTPQKREYYLDVPVKRESQRYLYPSRSGTDDRRFPEPSGTPSNARCHYYETERQGPFQLKDNEINFKISYYKTTNGQGYFHLPRRFDAWKQNAYPNSFLADDGSATGGTDEIHTKAQLLNNEYMRNNNTHLYYTNALVVSKDPANWKSAGTSPTTFTQFCLSPPVTNIHNVQGEAPNGSAHRKYGRNGWTNSPELQFSALSAPWGTGTLHFTAPPQDCWLNGKLGNLYEDYNTSSLRPCRADMYWHTGFGCMGTHMPSINSVVNDSGTNLDKDDEPIVEASYNPNGWRGKNDNSRYTLYVKEISYFSQPRDISDSTVATADLIGDTPLTSYIKTTEFDDDETTNNDTASRHDFYPYWSGGASAPAEQTISGATNIRPTYQHAERDPAISEYIKYEEVKKLSIPEGYNSATNVADDLTAQLNATTNQENIYGQVGGCLFGRNLVDLKDGLPSVQPFITSVDYAEPPTAVPIGFKKESETYKTFPCATSVTFNSEHHGTFFGGKNTGEGQAPATSQSQGGARGAQAIDYLSSYATIGVKRPELWEAGRKITKTMGRRKIGEGTRTGNYYPNTETGTGDWSWKQVIYPQIVKEMRGEEVNRQKAEIHTDWEWNEYNLLTLKEFFDAQGKYPELWEGVPFKGPNQATSKAKDGLSPTNSRYLHMNNNDSVYPGENPTGTLNWKYGLGSDNYGGTYIKGNTANDSFDFLLGGLISQDADITRCHSSVPIWFYYDSTRSEEADGGESDNTLYYGFAKKITYADNYFTESRTFTTSSAGNYSAGATTINVKYQADKGGLFKVGETIPNEKGTYLSVALVPPLGTPTPITITNAVAISPLVQTLTLASGLPADIPVSQPIGINFTTHPTKEAIGFTTANIGGLPEIYWKNGMGRDLGPISVSKSRTIGFDCHFSAYGSSAICLYTGILSGSQANKPLSEGSYAHTHDKSSQMDLSSRSDLNMFLQNPNVCQGISSKATLLDPADTVVPGNMIQGLRFNKYPTYQFIRERYCGASNPKLGFDTDSSRFNFQNLHSAEVEGATAFSGNSQVCYDVENTTYTPSVVDGEDIAPSVNNKVYFINKRFVNRNDYCPDLFPYEQEVKTADFQFVKSGLTKPDPMPKDTYTTMNPNITPNAIFDADGGIFIEDWGLSDDGSGTQTDAEKSTYQRQNWDNSLWSVLGFTYEQFHSSTTLSRQARPNAVRTMSDLGKLTTNAIVSQADLGKFMNTIAGGNYNNSQLSHVQNPLYTQSDIDFDLTKGVGLNPPCCATNYYPLVNQQAISSGASGINLPRKMINPYFLVKSDIVSDVKYIGGKESGQYLPIVFVVNKENGFGDFFFQSSGQEEFTITHDTTLSSITTSIHLPNMRQPLLNQGSSIIYKITKMNNAQLGVGDMLLQQELKKKQSDKKSSL